MHSIMFYIAKNINSKSEFEEILTPSEDTVYNYFSHIANCVIKESDLELEESIKFLSTSQEFFKIEKDDIGFYFTIVNKDLKNLQESILNKIKSQLTEVINKLQTNNKDVDNVQLLWQISDIACPQYEIMVETYDDYPESLQDFILTHKFSDPFETERPIRYYFIKSYNYNY